MLWGYVEAALAGAPRYEDPEFRRFLRRYQLRVLRGGKQAATTALDVLSATDYVVPALEILDSRIEMEGRTIVDTIADSHYGDKVKMAMAFAELLNHEARALEEQGVDVIQFDEPAFNVYMDDVKRWGIDALHRAIEGLRCKTAVHICYGYGIKANIDWKNSLGEEWRQYEEIFPALAKSRLDQVSVECIHARVPMNLLKLLAGKDVLVGVIDVASDKVETAEEVAGIIGEAMKYVPKERLQPCTNCGMAPMGRDIAEAKLTALGAGAALARSRFA